MPDKGICRKHEIRSATYYKWKSKYGRLDVSEPKRLKELEAELPQHERMYAEPAHANFSLKDVIGEKLWRPPRSARLRADRWSSTSDRSDGPARRWARADRSGTARCPIRCPDFRRSWSP